MACKQALQAHHPSMAPFPALPPELRVAQEALQPPQAQCLAQHQDPLAALAALQRSRGPLQALQEHHPSLAQSLVLLPERQVAQTALQPPPRAPYLVRHLDPLVALQQCQAPLQVSSHSCLGHSSCGAATAAALLVLPSQAACALSMLSFMTLGRAGRQPMHGLQAGTPGAPPVAGTVPGAAPGAPGGPGGPPASLGTVYGAAPGSPGGPGGPPAVPGTTPGQLSSCVVTASMCAHCHVMQPGAASCMHCRMRLAAEAASARRHSRRTTPERHSPGCCSRSPRWARWPSSLPRHSPRRSTWIPWRPRRPASSPRDHPRSAAGLLRGTHRVQHEVHLCCSPPAD